MFDKLQQIQKLKSMQDALGKERIEVEKQGCKIVINGKFETEELTINSELSHEEQERAVKECVNEGVRKVQTLVAQKMQEMGGLGF